jgi:Asp-tRNA(Asn)/Glu-tRNA(Gln) amidotransferase A subunit family amidase
LARGSPPWGCRKTSKNVELSTLFSTIFDDRRHRPSASSTGYVPSQPGAEMPYDLETVRAPRTAGLSLRMLVAALELSSPRSFLVRTLLDSAGVSALRALPAGAHSAIFVPPLEVGPRREASASERLEPAAFLASLVASEPGEGFAFRSAAQLTAAYRAGATTPTAVAEAALAAIEASEQGERPLRVFIAQQREDLLEQARASTERWARGAPLGPLDGVPVAVKDEMDQAGYPTTLGTVIHGGEPAAADASCVASFRAAGALLLGKTNMHEIGMGVTGLNPHHGACRNPYDPAHVTGGSSSGPAAAVAAGLCPISVGADGGGSIRIPAALCGVVGLKATFGRVSEHGVAPVCWSVAHAGPLGATVADCAAGYALMAGADPRDPISQVQPPPLLPDLNDGDLTGVRVGIYEPWFQDADPAVVAACQAAVDGLEAAGATVVPIEIPELAPIRSVHLISIVAEMAAAQIAELRDQGARYGLDTRLNMALATALTAQDFVHAQRHRGRLGEHWARVLSEVDVIATPSTGCTAPAYPADALPHGESNLPLTLTIMRFAQAANLFGLPGVSVPCGYDEAGLPVGLQLMGRAWEEALLLRMAAVVERGAPRRQPQAWWDLLG